MLKRHMAICLMATSLVGGAAFAQSTPSPAPASPPAASPAPAAPPAASPATSMSSAATGSSSAQFVTEQSSSHWLASKLVGVDVYGSDNAKIGDISEVLVNKDGMAEAIVIGVGGFLGIGQKNVAIPFKSVEWMNTPPASAGATKTTSTDTTGSTSTKAPAATASASTDSATRGYPDHAMVKMSKADLQNAPEFRYASEAKSTSTTASPPAGAAQKP